MTDPIQGKSCLNRRLSLVAVLLLLIQSLLILPAVLSEGQCPPSAVFGRYIIEECQHKIVANKTVQQLRNEGYDIQGESDWLLSVDYTRSKYLAKTTIMTSSWPDITVQGKSGVYDLNVTAYRIMEDGSISERLASFLRENQSIYMSPLVTIHDPEFGVGFDPSILVVGNRFRLGFSFDPEYVVNRTETLYDTPWGQNETYVLQCLFENSSSSYKWTAWCDAKSGIFVKSTSESMTCEPPATIPHKVYTNATTIETGVVSNGVEIAKEGETYELLVDTNSTITGFEFNATTNTFTIAVDGSSGTSGKFNASIPKKLLPEGNGLEVYIDGLKANSVVTEDSNNYYVYVTYNHSSHIITISLVPLIIWTQWWILLAVAAAVVILAGTVYMIRKRSKAAAKTPPASVEAGKTK